MPRQTSETRFLAERYGIGIDTGSALLCPSIDLRDSQVAMDAANRLLLAMDAAPTNALQSQLITAGNAGIPAYLSNYLDPEVVRVFTTPLKAVEIFGEQKKGDWTTDTAQFPMIEVAGEVSSYGDKNHNGRASANVNWEPRQSYHYQVFTEWGDKELAKAGLAKIDWASEQNLSSAIIMNTFQNKSYFFGVSGLDCYGLLNDPALTAPISPSAGAWTASTTGLVIVADITAIFIQLQKQLQDNISMDDELTLAMPATLQPYLLTPMALTYGSPSVKAYLKEAFPNMTVKTAVQYATTSGNMIQMIAPSVQGQKTGFCSFTEKMRAHAVVRETSSTHQKKSGGTWGAIIKLPVAIASGLGF